MEPESAHFFPLFRSRSKVLAVREAVEKCAKYRKLFFGFTTEAHHGNTKTRRKNTATATTRKSPGHTENCIILVELFCRLGLCQSSCCKISHRWTSSKLPAGKSRTLQCSCSAASSKGCCWLLEHRPFGKIFENPRTICVNMCRSNCLYTAS